jgi:hypothetical protein
MMTFPGDQSSPDAGGAVDEPVVTGTAPGRGEPVRRRQTLVDALYHQNSAVAELLAGMESVTADLDDDTLSGDLWSLQQACLRFDRDLRVRRR